MFPSRSRPVRLALLIVPPFLIAVAALVVTAFIYESKTPEPRRDSIAGALLAVNSRYRFTDGVFRLGWSTIHRLEPETASRVERALRSEAGRTGLPVNYLAAYVHRESAGDPKAEYRNVGLWKAAKTDRERFEAADHGLVQISGRTLLSRFPSTSPEELKSRAENIEFAVRFLADYVGEELAWARTVDVSSIPHVHAGLVERAGNPHWLAALAYNRGRDQALKVLGNPRACGHADLVVQSWGEIDAATRSEARPSVTAPRYPQLKPDDPRRLAYGDRGSGVEALQNLLNDRLPTDAPRLRPDGVFGTATKDAVARFQRSRLMEATGAADGATWDALMRFGLPSSSVLGAAAMGDSGPVVSELQRRLNRMVNPVPPLVVDGKFGPATRDAVVRFQARRGIAPTGVADGETTAALERTEP